VPALFNLNSESLPFLQQNQTDQRTPESINN